MAGQVSQIFTLFFLLLCIRDFSDCCKEWDQVSGCRIVGAESGTLQCLCGMGCKREFPFSSRTECEANILSKEGVKDPCQQNPCEHQGECIQVKYGGYRCECTGTNYYGRTCELECPQRIGANALGIHDNPFPLECIMI